MNNQNSTYEFEDKEINLLEILLIILREWKIASLIASSVFVVSCITVLQQKRVWEGQFQILIPNQDSSTLNSTEFFKTLGLGNRNSLSTNQALDTKVEILKSPSVLLPVFKYIKQKKKSEGVKVDRWRYKDWFKDNVSVALEPGTTILNVSYRDTDKDLIIPVLSKISNTYKNYSIKRKDFELSNLKEYLDDQITIFNKKSFDSYKKAEQFALDQDLYSYISPGSLNGPQAIEKGRTEAINKIRYLIEQKNSLINLLDNDMEFIKLSQEIPLVQEKHNALQELDSQISRLKSIFKNSDPELNRLIAYRKKLLDEIKDQSLIQISTLIQVNRNLKISLERPDGVLMKFNHLSREAIRDEKTLNNLLSNKVRLALEKEKNNELSQLVSEPYLFDLPVAPERRKIVTIATFFGLLIGSILALYNGKRKDLIYETSEVLRIINSDNILEIDKYNWDEKLILLVGKVIKDKASKSINVFIVGDISDKIKDTIVNRLKSVYIDLDIKINDKILLQNNLKIEFALFQKGNVKSSDLLDIYENSKLSGKKFDKWILLDNRII